MRNASWPTRAAAVAAMLGTLLAGASGARSAPNSLNATLTPYLTRYELPALAAVEAGATA